jgi:hypothetical protein
VGERVLTSAVLRLPPRRFAAVFICEERSGGGWLALAGSHGWLCGSRADAIAEAEWLARNLGLPVREIAT